MIRVLPIEEIKARMQRMRLDKKRGFPIALFAQFAGVDYRNLKKMFFEGKMTITELTQRKISRALLALENGEAGLRLNALGKKVLDYHPKHQQKPPMKRGFQIDITNGGPTLNIKPVNRYSYDRDDLFNF